MFRIFGYANKYTPQKLYLQLQIHFLFKTFYQKFINHNLAV
jgi:hypothetical protein